MLKISNFIVKFRWAFAILFLAIIIFSGFMIPKTQVTYDLSTYAPKGGMTEKSLKLMKKEFDDKGSVSVMIGGLTVEDAHDLCEEMADIKGIASVVFDENSGYKDNYALFSIMLEDYDSSEGANNTLTRFLDYLSDKDAYISGVSANTYFTRKAIEDEIMVAAIIIVVLIFVILLVTSRSFFELVIMLVVFGVAAVINLGTNFLLGEIAFLSNVIGLILQLVLAIDYSVILLHRFMDERSMLSPQESMVKSLQKGTIEILSSSLTTIAGMCALMLMTLPIGVELGIVLAKGIVISMLTVIFLMPLLLVVSSKLIEKTKHKSFVPSVEKPISKVLKARKIIAPIFALLVILAFVGQFFTTYSFNINNAKKITTNQKKTTEIFGITNTLVVIIPKENADKEQEIIDYMYSHQLINDVVSFNTLEVLPGIKLTDKFTATEFSDMAGEWGLGSLLEGSVNSLFKSYKDEHDPESQIPSDEYQIALFDFMAFVYELPIGEMVKVLVPQFSQLMLAKDNFESENYMRMMFNIDGPVEDTKTLDLIDSVTKEIGNISEEFYLAGESLAIYEMKEAFPNDNFKVVLLTALFILIILLFTFRNWLSPFVLMLTIQGSVWINFATSLITGIPTNYIGYLLISAIQMGATIDYAIILTNRYVSTKKQFLDTKEAMSHSVNAVFPTILTSGSILALTGFVLGFATNEPTISSLGMLLGVGTSLSVFMVLLVLPSLLLTFEKLTAKAKISFPKKSKKQEKTKELSF